MVARGGIELPTRGFSVPALKRAKCLDAPRKSPWQCPIFDLIAASGLDAAALAPRVFHRSCHWRGCLIVVSGERLSRPRCPFLPQEHGTAPSRRVLDHS